MAITSAFRYKIILGSGSPRRQQLLKDAGYDFKTEPINADESFPANLKAEQIALYLCEKKAAAYPGKLKEDELLITADTIVWIDDIVLNKPSGEFEAKQMLQLLSGKMHRVFTGVCITGISKKISFTDETKVWFKNLSENEIDFYIKNYKPFDKAGSYGAQDWLGLTGVEKIEGSYFNVMGLPVHRLYEEFQKL
ncbi:MAG TPA: Maf family nucleotide pyrophosphatase [Bacteroidia bacterium]|jgi:septum formation protein|nr:Maf family nucleotide pyrophosphatase [Bacteroidia bacterium]